MKATIKEKEVFTINYLETENEYLGRVYFYDISIVASGKTKSEVKDKIQKKIKKNVNFNFTLVG